MSGFAPMPTHLEVIELRAEVARLTWQRDEARTAALDNAHEAGKLRDAVRQAQAQRDEYRDMARQAREALRYYDMHYDGGKLARETLREAAND